MNLQYLSILIFKNIKIIKNIILKIDLYLNIKLNS